MKIDGACHCGHITYETEIDLEKIVICHCTDCQTLSGTAFRTVVRFKVGRFKLLSGHFRRSVRLHPKAGLRGSHVRNRPLYYRD